MPPADAAVYSAMGYEHNTLADAACRYRLNLRYIDAPLRPGTCHLSEGCSIVVVFAGDDASGSILTTLAAQGVRHMAVRAAGYDNVDMDIARGLGITVANVPEYSPHAIAEHAVALMQALNRKIVLADRQVHGYNFTVDNLVGFDLHQKTIGIIGTGRTGAVAARILYGFGCRLLGCDILPNLELTALYGLQYVDLDTLCSQADVITIHTCLTPGTRRLIRREVIQKMKRGVMLVNTSRGAVVNTSDVLDALKSGHIGAFGADVYERENGVFFYDRSASVPEDELLRELLQHPNVLVTPHQAFATREALRNIAETTCYSIACWVNRIWNRYDLP
jgi:D-lactate dehydrogenase